MVEIEKEIDKKLLKSLIRGVEDLKAGRIKPWKKVKNSSEREP